MVSFNDMLIESEYAEVKQMISDKIQKTDELMRQSNDALYYHLFRDAEKYAAEALIQGNPANRGLIPKIKTTIEYDKKYLDIKKHLDDVQYLRIKLCK